LIASPLFQIDEEQADSVGLLLDLIKRSGAREQPKHVRMLIARGENFLPVYDVLIALAPRERFDPWRLRTSIRFCNSNDYSRSSPDAIAGR
jgi:hypothetical protein